MNGPCPITDDVLAHFLDGQPDTLGQTEPLRRHLNECRACGESLTTARRLDALVAAGTRSDVPDPLADRLLTTALLERPTDRGRSEPVPRHRPMPWLAAGFAAALLLVAIADRASPPVRPSAQAQAPAPVAPSEAEGPRTVDPETLVLPSRRNAPRDASPRNERQHRRRAGTPDARSLEANMIARAWSLGLPLRDAPTAARRLARHLRSELLLAELGARRVQSIDPLVQFMAGAASQPLFERILTAARAHSALLHRVQRELRARPDDAVLRLAVARLGGGSELDRHLRAAVAGDRPGTEQVAAAAALPGRPRQVPFLLDLWADLDRRGAEPGKPAATRAGSVDRARRWFGELEPAATVELLDEAKRSRHAARRRHCLLALAARGDAAAVPHLLSVIDGARHEERVLGAFALARCATSEDLHRAMRRDSRRGLLLAALASMRDAALLGRLWQLDLTSEERAFLAAGDFSPHQLEIAATLLQRRARNAF